MKPPLLKFQQRSEHTATGLALLGRMPIGISASDTTIINDCWYFVAAEEIGLPSAPRTDHLGTDACSGRFASKSLN
jgi:hypothetical protein